jgi:hypothetical protein
MDPPHLTEFASERYFEKLNQLHASRQQAESADSGASTTTTTTTAAATANAQATSRFILPLREAKVPDVDAIRPSDSKQNRRFFGGIRQRSPSSTPGAMRTRPLWLYPSEPRRIRREKGLS